MANQIPPTEEDLLLLSRGKTSIDVLRFLIETLRSKDHINTLKQNILLRRLQQGEFRGSDTTASQADSSGIQTVEAETQVRTVVEAIEKQLIAAEGVSKAARVSKENLGIKRHEEGLQRKKMCGLQQSINGLKEVVVANEVEEKLCMLNICL